MIKLRDVCRFYNTAGERPVEAVRDVSFEIEPNDFVSVTGPSGCGKSTLMHLLGALDSPTRGEIFVGDLALHEIDEKQKTLYRRNDVGIVFQFFNLMPTMTVLENIALPLLLQGVSQKAARERARSMADMVGLDARGGHFIHQLSGGEMQRTAIGRALVHRPKLLIADEPTGNLDSKNADNILGLLRDIHSQELTTLFVVTHSPEVAEAASTQVKMDDGRLVSVTS